MVRFGQIIVFVGIFSVLGVSFYFYSGEILNKFSIIGGGSINNKWDTDLLLSFEYRKLKPTIYVNLFGITRHKNNLEYILKKKIRRLSNEKQIRAQKQVFHIPDNSYNYENFISELNT